MSLATHPMRVAFKLTMAILALIVAILAIEARLRSTREAELYEADLRKNQHVLGRALSGATELISRHGTSELARDVLYAAAAAEHEIGVRLIDLAPGSPHGPRLPLPVSALEKLRHGEEVVQVTSRSGTSTLYTFVPIDSIGRYTALELSTSLRGEAEYVRASTMRFLGVAAGMVVAAAIGSMLFGSLIVGRPVSALAEQARRVGRGEFTHRADIRQHDELGELARAFDAMADDLANARQSLEIEIQARISANEQLRHADRLAAVGTLAAGLAHELGTPLHVVANRARMAHHRSSDDRSRQDLEIVDRECERMAKIVQELLTFARSSSPLERKRRPVGELVGRATSLVEPLVRAHHVEIEIVAPDDELEVAVEPEKIGQVLTNLFINAVHAMPNGGALSVRWSRVGAPDGADSNSHWICIVVEDEGHGIAPENLDRIFDPFFTTKDVGHGVGLGLSVAHGIVRDHGGSLRASNRNPRGARFELWLQEAT